MADPDDDKDLPDPFVPSAAIHAGLDNAETRTDGIDEEDAPFEEDSADG